MSDVVQVMKVVVESVFILGVWKVLIVELVVSKKVCAAVVDR